MSHSPRTRPVAPSPFRSALTAAFVLLLFLAGCGHEPREQEPMRGTEYYPDARPWTRWWWFAGDVDSTGILAQLAWLREQGFGGVEIAWVYPRAGKVDAARQAWLSPEWSAVVTYAARCADSLGLGCDFTFGTLWPFGDSAVPAEDGTLVWGVDSAAAGMRLTWEHPVRGRVIDHLRRGPLNRYAERLLSALQPAMRDGRRGLFCDSWEVETDGLWTPGFDTSFARAYGYDIQPYMGKLREPGNEGVFYDYMKLVAEHVLRGFYERFTAIAAENNAFSRVQCAGSPTDLLRAYMAVDVPESESILFEPAFSRIPASAAALAGKPLVSSETFTCLYGWKGWPGPGPSQGKEQAADLKLLADALFASGVNHIVWHGTPYNAPDTDNRFYASVHVGKGGALAPHLRRLNAYMERVSAEMRRGRVYSDVAVYLPLEDAWMGVELPDSLQFPWAWGEYELRYLQMPKALEGRHPLWINTRTLRQAQVKAGRLLAGDCAFRAVYVDSRYLDLATVRALTAVARDGIPVILLRRPEQPGHFQDARYDEAVEALLATPGVTDDVASVLTTPPLLEGNGLPPYWCREAEDGLRIFFAHPLAASLHYPLSPGIGKRAGPRHLEATLRWGTVNRTLKLDFDEQESLLLFVGHGGEVRELRLPSLLQ